MGTTQGTPASVPLTARLMLQMATTTMPAIAMSAILARVRLGGGATRPSLRRRASLNHIRAPRAATTTAMPIQLTVGSMEAAIRLYSTCTLVSLDTRLG